MEPGTIYEGLETLFTVTLEGRGGDSVREVYFKTENEGIIASFRDGENRKPKKVSVEKFSDGTRKYQGETISVVPSVSDLTTKEKDEIIASLTPVQKVLFEERK
jgi:hypothetical protein